MSVPITPYSRYGHSRNMDSTGVSRALGNNSYRYAGVESAIRLARAESSENLLPSALLKKQVPVERGPRPNFLNSNN